MPAHNYVPQTPVYSCIQYDGTNFEEIIATGMPVVLEGGKVYLNTGGETPSGNIPPWFIPVPVNNWVLKDIYGAFTTLSDSMFQLGYRPGGGP